MPCESAYMEPSYDERESNKVCKLICYLFKEIGREIPEWVKESADDCYGNARRLGAAEKMLLNAVNQLSDKEKDKFVYNGRIKNARLLANWYEDILGKIQEEVEWARREAEEKKKAESLLSKMRADEVEILRNYLKDN